jgi:hypothetical protein
MKMIRHLFESITQVWQFNWRLGQIMQSILKSSTDWWNTICAQARVLSGPPIYLTPTPVLQEREQQSTLIDHPKNPKVRVHCSGPTRGSAGQAQNTYYRLVNQPNLRCFIINVGEHVNIPPYIVIYAYSKIEAVRCELNKYFLLKWGKPLQDNDYFLMYDGKVCLPGFEFRGQGHTPFSITLCFRLRGGAKDGDVRSLDGEEKEEDAARKLVLRSKEQLLINPNENNFAKAYPNTLKWHQIYAVDPQHTVTVNDVTPALREMYKRREAGSRAYSKHLIGKMQDLGIVDPIVLSGFQNLAKSARSIPYVLNGVDNTNKGLRLDTFYETQNINGPFFVTLGDDLQYVSVGQQNNTVTTIPSLVMVEIVGIGRAINGKWNREIKQGNVLPETNQIPNVSAFSILSSSSESQIKNAGTILWQLIPVYPKEIASVIQYINEQTGGRYRVHYPSFQARAHMIFFNLLQQDILRRQGNYNLNLVAPNRIIQAELFCNAENAEVKHNPNAQMAQRAAPLTAQEVRLLIDDPRVLVIDMSKMANQKWIDVVRYIANYNHLNAPTYAYTRGGNNTRTTKTALVGLYEYTRLILLFSNDTYDVNFNGNAQIQVPNHNEVMNVALTLMQNSGDSEGFALAREFAINNFFSVSSTPNLEAINIDTATAAVNVDVQDPLSTYGFYVWPKDECVNTILRYVVQYPNSNVDMIARRMKMASYDRYYHDCVNTALVYACGEQTAEAAFGLTRKVLMQAEDSMSSSNGQVGATLIQKLVGGGNECTDFDAAVINCCYKMFRVSPSLRHMQYPKTTGFRMAHDWWAHH